MIYSRKRIFVGVSGANREVFHSAVTPTAELFPQYGAAIGPFCTRAAADLMVSSYPNPHITCVADAEELVRRSKVDAAIKSILSEES